MANAVNSPSPRSTSTSQLLAMLFGVVYLVVGVVGFFITKFDNFADVTDKKLIIFQLNPLHNVVHIIIGLAGIALAKSLSSAKTYGILLAVVYGLTFLYGLAAVGNDDLNFLSINTADNLLHLATAIVGVVIFALPAETSAVAT